MNKNVKIGLWVGGIALASYLLYRFTKKSGTITKSVAEEQSNASASGKYKHKITSPSGCRERGGIPDGIGGCTFPTN